jgi:hypothetical protein
MSETKGQHFGETIGQHFGVTKKQQNAVAAIYKGLIDRSALQLVQEREELQQSVCKKVIDEIMALYEISVKKPMERPTLIENFLKVYRSNDKYNTEKMGKEALLKLHEYRKLIKREYFDDEQYDNTIEFLSKIYKKTKEPQLEQLQIYLTGLNDESETTDPPSSDSDVDYGEQIEAVERDRDAEIARLQAALPAEQKEGERKESDIRRSIAHQAPDQGAIRRDIALVRQRFESMLDDIRRASQAREYNRQMQAARRRILQKALTPDVYEIHRADIRFKRLVKKRVDSCHRFQNNEQVLPSPDERAHPRYEERAHPRYEEAYNKMISRADSELTDDECYRILEQGLNLVSAIREIDDYIGTHGPGVLKQMDLYLEYHLLQMKGEEDLDLGEEDLDLGEEDLDLGEEDLDLGEEGLDFTTFTDAVQLHLKIEKKIIELVQEKNTAPPTLDYLRREFEGEPHPDPDPWVVETKDVPTLKRMLRGDLSDLVIDELGERKEAIDDQLRFLDIITDGEEDLHEKSLKLTKSLQKAFDDRVKFQPYLESTCQLIEKYLQEYTVEYYVDRTTNSNWEIFTNYEIARLQDFQFRLLELQNSTPAHFEARESIYRKCQELQRCAQAYIQAQVQNTSDLKEKLQAVVAISNDFKPESTFISDMYAAMERSQPWRTFDRGPDVAKNRKWKILFKALRMSDDLIKIMPQILENILGYLIDTGISIYKFIRNPALEWQNSSIELDTPPTVASLAFAEKYVAKQRALEENFRRVEMMENFEKAREELRLSKMSPTQRKVETARLEYQEAQATLEYTESALKNNDVTFQQDPDGPPIIASSAAGQKLQEAQRAVSNARLKYQQAQEWVRSVQEKFEHDFQEDVPKAVEKQTSDAMAERLRARLEKFEHDFYQFLVRHVQKQTSDAMAEQLRARLEKFEHDFQENVQKVVQKQTSDAMTERLRARLEKLKHDFEESVPKAVQKHASDEMAEQLRARQVEQARKARADAKDRASDRLATRRVQEKDKASGAQGAIEQTRDAQEKQADHEAHVAAKDRASDRLTDRRAKEAAETSGAQGTIDKTRKAREKQADADAEQARKVAEEARQKNIEGFNKDVKERVDAKEEADEKAQHAEQMTQQQTKISESVQRRTNKMQGDLNAKWWSSLGNIVTVEAFKMVLGAAFKKGTEIAFENISPATFESTLNAMQKESGAKVTDAWVEEGQRVLEALKENAQNSGADSFTRSGVSAEIFKSEATIDFLTRMEDFVEKAGFMKNLGSLGADSTILAKLLKQNTFNELASKVMNVGFTAEVGLDGISVKAQAQIKEAFKNHGIDQALRGVDAGLRTGVSLLNIVRNNRLRLEMDADTRDILEALVGFARVDADEFCEGDSMGICAAKPATKAHESAQKAAQQMLSNIKNLEIIVENTGLYSETFWFGIFLQVAGTASVPWTGPAGVAIAAKGATMSAYVGTVNRAVALGNQALRLAAIVNMKDAATKGLAEFNGQVGAAYQLSRTSTNLLGREAALRGAGKYAEARMVKQFHTAFREVITYIKDVAATQSNPSREDIVKPLDIMRGIQELSHNLWENEI